MCNRITKIKNEINVNKKQMDIACSVLVETINKRAFTIKKTNKKLKKALA